MLVESYRPGVMARLGLDYASLRESCPRLVYVSLSGYGQAGPWADLPGHDINYLAAAGVLAVSGAPEGPPAQNFGLPVADLCGGMYALSSTLAALLQRQSSGQGQHLDVALADCALHWMNPRLGAYGAEAAIDLAAQRQATLVKPAYGAFRCRDGQFISLAALEDHFWARLCQAMDMGPFAGEAYLHLGARKEAAEAINARIGEQLAAEDAPQALDRLSRHDLPVAPVVAPADLAAVPHFGQRGLFVQDQPLSLVRYPVALAGMERQADAGAPALDNARQQIW